MSVMIINFSDFCQYDYETESLINNNWDSMVQNSYFPKILFRFLVLRSPICQNFDNTICTVLACCVLHNFLSQKAENIKYFKCSFLNIFGHNRRSMILNYYFLKIGKFQTQNNVHNAAIAFVCHNRQILIKYI